MTAIRHFVHLTMEEGKVTAIGWLLIMLSSGIVDFIYVHSTVGKASMFIGTCIAALMCQSIMSSFCENQGPHSSILRMWWQAKGLSFSFVATGIAMMASASIAVGLVYGTELKIFWPGILISYIPLAISIVIGGMLGVREQFYQRKKLEPA